MSGLEALAALSLACNIFQVVSFGRETLVLVKDAYQNGAIDDSLMYKSIAIQDVASDIIAVKIPPSLGKNGQKLVEVANKCTAFAKDLQEDIAFLMRHNPKGRLRATLWIAFKSNLHRGRLERMSEKLKDCEQLMQSSLLAWIFEMLSAASINIDSLDKTAREFVHKYEQGHRQASELVSQEALKLREAIERESRKTEGTIRDYITQTSAKSEQRREQSVNEARKEQFRIQVLDSLKYPGINERANEIEPAHAGTFRWLFADTDNLNVGTHIHKHKGSKSNWYSFEHWLQTDHNLYWVMGKPGSGKSTLARFILSEPRTKAALERWHHDVLVVSHFFWRSGALLQRNIRGMLCSILHQLVIAIPDALEYASSHVAELAQKYEHTDWSITELQHLCCGLIRHCGKPMCLLVDGLDECGPEDDHERLLKTLDEIRLANVKMIVSSRNEPIFERRFGDGPQVRMQDLMASDLRAYAKDKLHQHSQYDAEFLDELVNKAEGVFLWLVLAVKSINRGFDNGDYEGSPTKLRMRMEALPRRLRDLYKDMWERLNDDADIYRRDAALYFSIVIAARDGRLQCMDRGLSTMEMMLASSEASHDAFSKTSVVSVSSLLGQCERFHKKVEVRCAGLLSTLRGSTEWAQEGMDETERALLDYAHKDRGFQFIHRSAHDFFVDTIDGRNILRHEGMHSEDLGLYVFRAGLRAAELLHSILGKAAKRRVGSAGMYTQQRLEIYLSDLSRLAESKDSVVEALFSRCFELYSSSKLQHRADNNVCLGRIATFFGVAAYHDNLDPFSLNMIEKRLFGDIRSEILLAIVEIGLGTSLHNTHRENLPVTLARCLLCLYGVATNLKSSLVVSRPFNVFSWGWEAADEMGPFDHIKISPFSRLLSFGLTKLDWKPIRLIRNQLQMTQFLQLVCDFVSRGGDFDSMMFLACPDPWNPDKPFRPKIKWPHLFEMPGWDFHVRSFFEHDDRVLCIMALTATTVIQRMLASLLITDCDSSAENKHGLKRNAVAASDLEAAVSVLAQKCLEYGRRPICHVVGLLQPGGNFANMPYRLVSQQDSVDLIMNIWTYMDGPEPGVCWDDPEASFWEVVARSPFSSIGFRDYLKSYGCFDEFAAHTLLMDR